MNIEITFQGLIGIGFIILTIALLIFSISYAFCLTEEEDEKEHEEWAKENYPEVDHQSLNTSNNNNIKILVCGPIHKLMEQWLKPNDYKCHKA